MEAKNENHIMWKFRLTAATMTLIPAAVGILYEKGYFDKADKGLPAALVIALASAVISIPLNMIFWGGQTGIAWGDTLFAYMTAFCAQNLVEAGIVLVFTLTLVFVLPVFSRNPVTKEPITAFIWLQTLEGIGFQKLAWLTKVGGDL